MSAIFCHGDEQMRLANESMKAAQIDLKKEIQTVIQPAGPFYQAEEWVFTTRRSIFVVSICLPQLPPEVHPAEAWLSIDLNRALSWTKTCRKQPRSKTKRLPWWLRDQGKLENASQHIQSTTGELSGRNGDVEPAKPRQHWLRRRWDRASHLSSLLELKPNLSYMPCCLLPMMNTGKLQASRLMNI